LFLLNRQASCAWLDSVRCSNGAGSQAIPALAPEERDAVVLMLKKREGFQPWTHHLAETFSALPYIKHRFPYHDYVQKVGHLEADGWLVRVYVNHEADER
jgi:hypothetical protein